MDSASPMPHSAESTSLPASVTTLETNGCRYYVIGTAHVSQTSVNEVRDVIATLKPDVVAVELCQARYDALSKDAAFRDLDVFKIIREGKALYLLGHLALAAYQRKMGAALGVKPGAELLAAIDAGRAQGCRIELIDRDVNITLKRTWANVGWWKRSKLLASAIVGEPEATPEPQAPADQAQAVEELKDPKTLAAMLAEFARVLPEVKGPLIDERDQFLVSGMTDVARDAKSVVAVVGAAHVPGMTQWFGQPVDRTRLNQLPKPSLAWTLAKWLIPVLLVGIFALAWRNSQAASFWELLLGIVLPTSIGAGLFTLLAGGRPLSVLSALLVAPLAFIHPLLGTAMVVGVVEAWRRKPSVRDCEALAEDTQSLQGYWQNPVTRILIIAIASGLGTSLGGWLGVGWIIGQV